jgi:hypothetical protein
MYFRLGQLVTDTHQRAACRLLADVESATGRILRPVADRYGIRCDADDAWRRGEDYIASWAHEGWFPLLERVVPLAKRALQGMQRLAELCDDRNRLAIARLLAHEEAILEFTRRETTGAPDALAPLSQYLADNAALGLPAVENGSGPAHRRL